MLRILAFFAIIVSPLSFNVLHAQCWSVPLSLDQRIAESQTIVLGSLVEQQGYWDENKRDIYTLNIIRVEAYLKGQGPTEIAVATMGGVVGLDAQVTIPSLKIRPENEYVFFLNPAASSIQSKRASLPQFVPYGSPQGAIPKQFEYFIDTMNSNQMLEADLLDRIQFATQQSAQTPDGEPFAAREGITNPIWQQVARKAPITNVTPNPTHAGTVDSGDYITITGSGFGAESSVFYANANDGGGTLIASGVASDNVSWSDTEVVNKPAGDAGTGTISVNGQTSSVTIDWAHIEINSDFFDFGETTRQLYRLVDKNGTGGLTLVYNEDFYDNTAAKESFERALDTWRCTSFVNFEVDTTTTSTIGSAVNDGVNIVTFVSLPTGVLGRATSRFSGNATGSCDLEDTVWWLNELDVQFAPDPPASGFTWNYGPGNPSGSQFDFETVALHELGHGHGLGHVIDGGALMHYASSNGTTARTVDSKSEAGANAKMAYSTVAPCFLPGGVNGEMVALSGGTCNFSSGSSTDLAVSKIVTDANPDEGDTITYTITVTNDGPVPATSVSITDQLPNGVTRTGTAANASQGSFDEGTGVWTIGTLNVSDSVTLGLEVTVDAGAGSLSQPITNSTSALTLTQTDSNAANDTGSVGITVGTPPTDLDLAVDKIVSDATPDEGDTITYTITVSNNGAITATNVALTDQLPTGVTRTGTAANASQGSFDEGTGVWTIGSIPASSNATLGLEVTVDAGASSLSQPITNTTSNLVVDQTDTNAGNDSDSATITVSDNLDLAVSKIASNTTPDEGATFTYTITVANAGPAQATNVALTDQLPNGVTRTGTAANASQGSFDEGTGVWTVGTLASGGNATLGLEVTVDAGASSLSQPITNTTSNLVVDQTDTNAGNNAGSATITVSDSLDLAVSKIASDTTPDEGDTFTYTITVANAGPAQATNVALTDQLPDGVTRTGTAANASQGSFDEGTGVWTVGTLASGDNATLGLEVTVDAGAASLSQPITNTTSNLVVDQTDSNAGNNAGSATITVGDSLDLAVSKTVSDETPDEGSTITYTITVSNAGPAQATNVALTDQLPDGVTRTGTAANASQGSFDEGTGVWTVGTLASGGNATLGLEVTVDAGASSLSQPITNTTSNLVVDQTDSNAGNDSDSASITVSDNLDLEVAKSVSDPTPTEGDTITYTITVTNNGPAQATNVALTDQLPDGVTRTATAANASQGSFDEGTGVWTVGTLASGGNATLGLEVTVDAGAASLSQPITNTTSNLVVDQTDTNAGNDTDSATINLSDGLDLAVGKTVSDATPQEGDTVTYTITVTNDGPIQATNVALTDQLPNGVTRTATAAGASQGSFDEGTGIWTVGTLANAASATLTLEVTVDVGAAGLPQPITNSTSNLTVDQTELNAANDIGSVDINVDDSLDLVVGKTVDNSTPNEGDTISYTITVTNSGPTQATNVALTDQLPDGVTRTATPANASQGSFDEGTGVWTIGTMADQAQVTLTLEATVDSGAASLSQPITNTTTNLVVDQSDSDGNNDSASASITVGDATDLAVSKVTSNAMPQEGDTFTYTITVTNNGPTQATNVALTDQLPNGVTRTATATAASQGSFDEGTGVWTVGTLDDQAVATLALEVSVDNGAAALTQPIVNSTSNLVLDQADSNSANNTASADITVGTAIDLAAALSASGSTFCEGDTFTYTLAVTNQGPEQATSVTITLNLPDGVTRTATAANADQGSYSDATGIWQIGDLAASTTVNLTVEVDVDAGAADLTQPLSATTSAATADQTDGNATNDASSVGVVIAAGLEITSDISNQDACEGGSVTFTFGVDGASPIYLWYKDGQPLDGEKSASLTLTNLQASDAAFYFCEASNDCGTVTSFNAELTLSGTLSASITPPFATQGLDTITLTGQVNCDIQNPSYEWLNLTTSETANGAVLQLPTQFESSVWQLTVTDPTSLESTSVTAAILASGDSAFFDYNNDGCNDVFDLFDLGVDWNSDFTGDPNGDDFIDVRDLLLIDISDGQGCQP